MMHSSNDENSVQQPYRNKLISRPWLIVISAIVITLLLGLPRLSMMIRLEEIGLMDFDNRDYLRRLLSTFLFASLMLSFNLYLEKIKLGFFTITFSRISHLLLANALLLSVLVVFRTTNRIGIDALQNPGNLILWNMAINAAIAVVCILIAITYRYVKENYQVKLENEALQKETAQARFIHLREQVNPHFMFNSFSTLNGLIEESPDRARNFLMNMSDVYRYVLKSENATTVRLEEELHFTRMYAAMIKERFGEAVCIQFDVAKDLVNRQVVPLSVQTLLENAVKHNNFDKAHPLQVRIRATENYLEVQNTLRKRFIHDSKRSLGLYNLNQRYQYASKQEIVIDQTDETFTIKIPLLK